MSVHSWGMDEAQNYIPIQDPDPGLIQLMKSKATTCPFKVIARDGGGAEPELSCLLSRFAKLNIIGVAPDVVLISNIVVVVLIKGSSAADAAGLEPLACSAM
uniref:Uncharacterized protein n=1 Tax=Romanomermis culicivorax TaxID=13658 RepID=A0A915KYD7_ROMCU